ncbi:hypothetical protein LUZ63_005043 [Rhynchospora breviuscula]|uniref:Uncharacterized protein n=1 Tax=Rhynchospora breviuscula TaxID=2022672 RepID=A0A9Q0CM56_9POAL|nr:hypothetical protein LUZ63_005043 [Rhynchospora breviuscula]
MRAPAILFQCFPALLPHERTGSCVSIVPERDLSLPSPAVEILPPKNAHPYKYAGERVDVQGLNIFKGRVSVADLIGFTSSDMSPSKIEGNMRYWESSINLVNVLKNEIRDGQLNFRGKKVLELSCGSGLAGSFACLKGASTVHFHDQNAETLRCRTIPNVLANLEEARDMRSRPSESPMTPSHQVSNPDVHFYASDWDELHTILSLVNSKEGLATGFSFSEEDLLVCDGSNSQDGSGVESGAGRRRSRKLSGSRAWERGNEMDQGDGGYDVVLISDLPYSISALRKLYAVLIKCLRPPYGVVYLAAKKNLVGSNGGVRQMKGLLDEGGILGAHLVCDSSDREIWKVFFK